MSALRWADVDDAADGDGVLVTVRRGKTNQEGETTDVRFVKGAVAVAVQDAAGRGEPGARAGEDYGSRAGAFVRVNPRGSR